MSDPAGELEGWLRDRHHDAAFVVLTRSQELAYPEAYRILPPMDLIVVKRSLMTSPRYRVVFSNRDAVILTLSDAAAPAMKRSAPAQGVLPGNPALARIASFAAPSIAAGPITLALALVLLLAAPGLVWLRHVKPLRLAEIAILSIAVSIAVAMLAASLLALVWLLSPVTEFGALVMVVSIGIVAAKRAPIPRRLS
jgi:hypothetical protein